MKTIPSLLITVFLIFSAHAVKIVDVNFNNHSEGFYTDTMLGADWLNPSWSQGIDKQRVSIVSNPSFNEKSLRVLYPELGVGPDMSGAQWPVKFDGYEELFSSYYLFFPNGWNGVKGGKLPGLCGAECPTGGEDVTGYNGFSARYMFRPSMKLVIYLYHMDKPGEYGEDFLLDFSFERNVWYKLTQRIKMNTPNLKDGEIQVWVDNQEVLNIDTLRFRAIDTVKIDQFYFSTFYGGSTPDWAPLSDQYIYYDEFSVYTDANVMIKNKLKQCTASGNMLHIACLKNGDIRFTLDRPELVTFQVLNLQGRCLRVFKPKDKPLITLSSQSLPTGAYIMQAVTPRQVLRKVFTLID